MKPQKGYAVIRSSSLAEAFSTLVTLIVQFTYDDAGSTKKGFELLAKDGYFIKLQNQLKASMSPYIHFESSHIYYISLVIFDEKLDRTPRVKYYFGREHVHILLSTMLSETEAAPTRRCTVLQSMARVLLSFFATCRPSTLGYTEKKWRDAGMVFYFSSF